MTKKTFIDLRKETTKLAFTKKHQYYTNKISSHSTTKGLFECVNELTDNTKSSSLPEYTSSFELANRFNTFSRIKSVK